MKVPWLSRLLILGIFAPASLLLSCGGNPSTNCTLIGLNVSPASASADHAAVSPGNRVQFTASAKLPAGCVQNSAALPAIPMWTSSDDIDINISNAAGSMGRATCLNATPQPATITATLPGGQMGTATLTCQ